MVRALITGINGQDGSYLSEYLLSLGYEVFGMVRRNSVVSNQSSRLNHLSNITTDYGDVNDISSILSLLKLSQPDEIYHLAAQSHVQVSFKTPQYTLQTNTIGTLNLLEAVRILGLNSKIYNAASSEMFGNNINSESYQDELTPMHPVSPYGVSKLSAYSLCKNYRNSYGMFIANGILFNHESPRRGGNFVTQKIVQAAKKIKEGKQSKLVLGNLYACRDWGHAADYVKAMHLMLQQPKPDDFVVATGEMYNVEEVVNFVFTKLGMDYIGHLEVSDKYKRPEELHSLRGNPYKAKTKLGWKPKYTFETTLEDMINAN